MIIVVNEDASEPMSRGPLDHEMESPNVQTTTICCAVFRKEFLSLDGWQYFGFPLWDLEVYSIIIRGGGGY
jgi:hypothetical protein